MTTDQVELLKRDNVVSDDAVREQRTLEGLGIKPMLMEAVLPSYLWRYRKAGQYATASRHNPSNSAANPAAPTMIRHQAKTAKLWRWT